MFTPNTCHSPWCFQPNHFKVRMHGIRNTLEGGYPVLSGLQTLALPTGSPTRHRVSSKGPYRSVLQTFPPRWQPTPPLVKLPDLRNDSFLASEMTGVIWRCLPSHYSAESLLPWRRTRAEDSGLFLQDQWPEYMGVKLPWELDSWDLKLPRNLKEMVFQFSWPARAGWKIRNKRSLTRGFSWEKKGTETVVSGCLQLGDHKGPCGGHWLWSKSKQGNDWKIYSAFYWTFIVGCY